MDITTSLLGDISNLIDRAKNHLSVQFNSTLVSLNWEIGFRIDQDILKHKRADYGKQIISQIAKELQIKYGRGFDRASLFRMVQFSKIFPEQEIVATLSQQLSWSHFLAIITINEMIDILVKKGAKIDIQDYKGNTSLHYAANIGYIDSVGLLTKRSDNVNLVNKDGDTALHIALNNKDERVVEAFLDNARGIDFNLYEKNKRIENPLSFAARVSTAKIVQKMLDKGAKVDKYSLHNAAGNTYVEEIIDDIDTAKDMQYEIVNKFISLGCNVNALDDDGNTPLFYAVEQGNNEVAQELVRCGTNTSVKNKEGYTVFEYAIRANRINIQTLSAILPKKIHKYVFEDEEIEVEVVDTEKAREILSKVRDNNGNTLLHHAVKYGCSREMLNFLVENGVDINTKNKNGVAPIHIAAKYGNESLLDFFIENKADLNAKCGNFTKSEIDVTEKNFINVQEGSGDESSVINVKNDTEHKKETPIAIAASNNHDNAVGKLLSEGVKSNVGNNRGWTPIYIAMRIACDENYTQEEREKAYNIIEKLAVFSHNLILPKKAEANERIKKILENALKSREDSKLPSAPVDDASAPPLDDDFFCEIGSYVKDILELRLYPDLSEELKKLEKSNINVNTKQPKQKIESVSKMRFTYHDREKLNKFSEKVAKAKNIAELNQVVNEALKSGVRLNYNENDSFTNVTVLRVQELNKTKEDAKIASAIICTLVSKGADISKENYKKINQELETVFKDHKTNIQKAYIEANKRISDFHDAVADAATNGKIELIEIDNTTFYLEYSADSTVDVAKAIEAARGLGLYDGNITFGSNIVKIGESAVEVETSNGIRSYTDLSDNGDVIITFQTSLGVLDVRLYVKYRTSDFIKVEVCNPERFNQLVNIKEEIGSCLFGELPVYDAIIQGCFKRSGKLQSSETIKILHEDENLNSGYDSGYESDIKMERSSNDLPSSQVNSVNVESSIIPSHSTMI